MTPEEFSETQTRIHYQRIDSHHFTIHSYQLPHVYGTHSPTISKMKHPPNRSKRHWKHFETPPPPKYFSYGTKHGNILHTRLRIGMSHLNAHLYPQQLSESPECLCGSSSESVQHFVLICPLYQNPRDSLFQSLSIHLQINVTTLPSSELLSLRLNGPIPPSGSDRAVAHLFQNFLSQTGRFRLNP